MKGRKFISVGLVFISLLVCITGILLFLFKGVLPPYINRYSKEIHEWISMLFIVFMAVHIVYNFKPLVKYFVGKNFAISKEAVVNFAIVAVLTGSIVVAVSNKLATQSNSKYPSVESIELKLLLESSKINYDNAITNLQKNGYIIPENDLTLNKLAQANNVNPKHLYSIMTSK